ncbi:MAG: chlorophyllide reductase iron protein subunit X, partial [Pseudomonadota bacterium]
AVQIPVLASIPANEDIRRKSANYEIIGKPEGKWGDLFAELGTNVAEAPPRHPTPLTHDELLGLFKSEDVGGSFSLEPATFEDMCGVDYVERTSLEVIYDQV